MSNQTSSDTQETFDRLEILESYIDPNRRFHVLHYLAFTMMNQDYDCIDEPLVIETISESRSMVCSLSIFAKGSVRKSFMAMCGGSDDVFVGLTLDQVYDIVKLCHL